MFDARQAPHFQGIYSACDVTPRKAGMRLNSRSTAQTCSDVQLGFATPKHPFRPLLEAFIRSGFKRAHNADIHSFMPNLFFLKNDKAQAVLGVRSGLTPLFLEQYLTNLETCLHNKGVVTSRHQLVEIGNLYSTSSPMTQRLLIYTLLTLALENKTHILFTGIPAVTRIFNRFRIPLTQLCDAKQSAVKNGPDDWGRYYQHHPKVMVLAIHDALDAIDQSPALSQLRDALMPHIVAAHKKLATEGSHLEESL